MKARARLAETLDLCLFVGALVGVYAAYRVVAWVGRWPR